MNWAETTLGDFSPFVYGRGLPSTKRSPGSVPVYGSNGIVGSHNEPLVSESVVVVGRKGSVGEVHFAEKPSWVIDTAFYVKETETADLRFVYYLLKTLPIRSSHDSAVPGLSRDFAHSLRIKVPDYRGQQRIGAVLATLDRQIDLNEELSATLESIAQTLFRSWFVDFDPVRAKMAGQKPVGMDDATAALFPDSMEESELGEIPAGWTICSIQEFGKVVTGKTPSTKQSEYWGGEIPFATIPDLHRDLILISTMRCLSDLGANSQQSKTIPAGSTMVSCIATPGLVAYAGISCQTNQQINSVVPNPQYSPIWLFWHMRSLIPTLITSSGVGTVFANLNKNDFSSIMSVTPPKTVRDAFARIATPLTQAIENLRYESESLREMRDALLPRLISGELQVPEDLVA